jgi:hypothetical protein
MNALLAEARELQPTIIESETTTLFARGINRRNQRRCPHCDSIVYSRRTGLCGVCDRPLPDACLFSPEQAQSVALLLSEERRRHRDWLNRANFGS